LIKFLNKFRKKSEIYKKKKKISLREKSCKEKQIENKLNGPKVNYLNYLKP